MFSLSLGLLRSRAPFKVSVAQDHEYGEVVDGLSPWILQQYCAEENFKNFSFLPDLINICYDLII